MHSDVRIFPFMVCRHRSISTVSWLDFQTAVKWWTTTYTAPGGWGKQFSLRINTQVYNLWNNMRNKSVNFMVFQSLWFAPVWGACNSGMCLSPSRLNQGLLRYMRDGSDRNSWDPWLFFCYAWLSSPSLWIRPAPSPLTQGDSVIETNTLIHRCTDQRPSLSLIAFFLFCFFPVSSSFPPSFSPWASRSHAHTHACPL